MFTRHFSTLRCTVHSGKCSKSSHIDCTRETAYGVNGTDASLCAVHRLIGMIKLNSLSESCVEKSKQLKKTSALLKEQQKTPEQFRLKVCRSQSEKCCPKKINTEAWWSFVLSTYWSWSWLSIWCWGRWKLDAHARAGDGLVRTLAFVRFRPGPFGK